MTTPRVPLFDRLPEIYRTRDAEQTPPDQLRAYLAAIESPFGALHENIAQLYDDLFIDTCDDWVVPYLADLLGTTHLKGEPRTLRADVADTIALRRRKGTLGAIERLAVNLTGWACRAVELRENLGWSQHLNHQRPDAGGVPPYAARPHQRASWYRAAARRRFAIRRRWRCSARRSTTSPTPPTSSRRSTMRGTSTCRIWRSSCGGSRRISCRWCGRWPRESRDLGPQPPGLAQFAVRFDLHPLDLPVRLFNTSRPGFLRRRCVGRRHRAVDRTGRGAWPDARRAADQRIAGWPSRSLREGRRSATTPPRRPRASTSATPDCTCSCRRRWSRCWCPRHPRPNGRGASAATTCAPGRPGLRQPLRYGEIVIDPAIGRVLIGMDSSAQARRTDHGAGRGIRAAHLRQLHLRGRGAGRRPSGAARLPGGRRRQSTCGRSARLRAVRRCRPRSRGWTPRPCRW